jgi:hypothetical protein
MGTYQSRTADNAATIISSGRTAAVRLAALPNGARRGIACLGQECHSGGPRLIPNTGSSGGAGPTPPESGTANRDDLFVTSADPGIPIRMRGTEISCREIEACLCVGGYARQSAVGLAVSRLVMEPNFLASLVCLPVSLAASGHLTS